jgi:hypothetical protein
MSDTARRNRTKFALQDFRSHVMDHTRLGGPVRCRVCSEVSCGDKPLCAEHSCDMPYSRKIATMVESRERALRTKPYSDTAQYWIRREIQAHTWDHPRTAAWLAREIEVPINAMRQALETLLAQGQIAKSLYTDPKNHDILFTTIPQD